ncbi:MAG: DUF2905 domain-containing protein [Azovibrio sp.]
MLKWLLTLVIAIGVLSLLAPWFRQHLKIGRLPGDVTLHYRGRNFFFPFTSTILLSLFLFLITRWL